MHLTMIVCDIIVCVCFLVMPIALQTLFLRKRIGHILDGWFNAISAVFFTCSLYRLLNVLVDAEPGFLIAQALSNVLTAAAAAAATLFLVWKQSVVERHPEQVVGALELALMEMRTFVRDRGATNEPGASQQRGA